VDPGHRHLRSGQEPDITAQREARVGDEESSDVQWFDVDDLPDLLPRFHKQLAMALADDAPVLFGAAARER
jgi:hypothetical protein